VASQAQHNKGVICKDKKIKWLRFGASSREARSGELLSPFVLGYEMIVRLSRVIIGKMAGSFLGVIVGCEKRARA
jgi:hypothetical protein